MSNTVLLVDDEPHLTQSLKRGLRNEPYRVVTASSGEEGLEVLASEPVDVVVSDESMPGMSGAEFVAQVARAHPDTVRMILTGQATLDAVGRAINQGSIFRFFTKPCNEIELIHAIRQGIQQRDLMIQTRRMLEAFKEQAMLIDDLESSYPGITRVKKNTTGSIVVEHDSRGLDALIDQIHDAMEDAERRTKGRGGLP